MTALFNELLPVIRPSVEQHLSQEHHPLARKFLHSTMDYDKFLSAPSSRREPSQLRQLGKKYLTLSEKYYPLCGGLPSTDVFNFKEGNLQMKDGSQLHLDENMMEIAQQYGVSEGYQSLLNILRDFQVRLHSPPMKDWEITITNGSQDAICKSLEMLLNEGDYIIGGDHCYSGTLEIVRAIGANYVEVQQDHLGMCPDVLRSVLARWDVETCRNNKKIAPKCIYLVPNGGNPEARTISADRRKKIYEIAQEYDLLIIEDDPYQFVLFDEELPPSFLSMDVDGRVIRCDSFSKTISPGLRLGYLTAAAPLVKRVLFHIQVSSQQPACLSQVVLYQLLLKWGFEGYVKKAKLASDIYKKNKNMAVKFANKWLKDVAEWEEPAGGMFLWIKIKGVKDSLPICEKAMDRMVNANGPPKILNQELYTQHYHIISLRFSLHLEGILNSTLQPPHPIFEYRTLKLLQMSWITVSA